MKIGFCGLLACLAAGASVRGAAPEDEGWIRISGPHFTVLSHASESATREVSAEVAGYEDCLGKFIHADPARLKPLTIVLFASDDEFEPYKRRTAEGRSIDDIQQERDIITVGDSGGGREWEVIAGVRRMNYSAVTRRTILEGCAGWYISALPYHVPLALRRGTARMLSTFQEGSDTAKFGQVIPAFLPVLSRWRLMPVEKLLQIDHYEDIVDQQMRVTFEAESWAFAHYLYFARGPMKRHAFSAFWSALKEGRTPHEALVRALGPEGVRTIDADLQSYFQGIRYTVSLPFDHSGRTLGPSGPAGPMEVEIGLAKAAYIDRPEAAVSHAQAAVAAAGGRPEAYVMLADALIRNRAGTRAIRAAVADAIARGSRSAWILTADAANRLEQAGGASAAPASFRAAVNQAEKAVMADRGYQPAFDLLARSLFFADHVTADDGKFLAFGRGEFPRDRWILVGQAALLLRQGDSKRAEGLERMARNPDPLLASDQIAPVGAYLAGLPPGGPQR